MCQAFVNCCLRLKEMALSVRKFNFHFSFISHCLKCSKSLKENSSTVTMAEALDLNLYPSCYNCLSWSDDGELAVAAGDTVHLQVHSLKTNRQCPTNHVSSPNGNQNMSIPSSKKRNQCPGLPPRSALTSSLTKNGKSRCPPAEMNSPSVPSNH